MENLRKKKMKVKPWMMATMNCVLLMLIPILAWSKHCLKSYWFVCVKIYCIRGVSYSPIKQNASLRSTFGCRYVPIKSQFLATKYNIFSFPFLQVNFCLPYIYTVLFMHTVCLQYAYNLTYAHSMFTVCLQSNSCLWYFYNLFLLISEFYKIKKKFFDK